MREIKFRIWDDTKKKMIYLCEENVTMEEFMAANREGRLMLDSGLKDIDDKPIYEGDYVKIFNTYKEEYFMGKIIYNKSTAEFVIESEQLTKHKRWINYDMRVLSNACEEPNYLVLNSEKKS